LKNSVSLLEMPRPVVFGDAGPDAVLELLVEVALELVHGHARPGLQPGRQRRSMYRRQADRLARIVRVARVGDVIAHRLQGALVGLQSAATDL
jgi:hypothetical protein